jgi:(+)-trans-carveol dehydrogenase
MTGRVEGKVAFITGAACGQGRSHAIRLAQEGADIIAVDISAQVGSVPYPRATPEDLAETVKEVEALDRRIVAAQADVRDFGGLKEALDDGVAQLGRLDIVCSNAKHGVVGLMRTLALELAPHFIRVNSLHPSTVDTDMIQNEATYRLFRPDLRDPGAQELVDAGRAINALPIPWLEPVDISNAVLFLASDEARYITGVTLPVDAGFLIK